MRKKKIVLHSNSSRAYTGFGKNLKNVISHLYSTGKYEIVEFANGLTWNNPDTKLNPWKTIGSLPEDQKLINQLNKDPQLARQASYGAFGIDELIKQEKPDLYIGIEDPWAFLGYPDKNWWNKINCMLWVTLDSLPIFHEAVKFAPKVKNYYVWSSFAEKALHELGHPHVKALGGAIDYHNFKKLGPSTKISLRAKFGIDQDSFIIGFVFRNQLRKSVPNLLDGYQKFIKTHPESKAKLLLHTNWKEGWNIMAFLGEKGINPSDILTTYTCSKCRNYKVHPFQGHDLACPFCGNEKTFNTISTGCGVTEKQLNEIYNLMDVYCHPFTSGGQEIPIQEAKLCELITLVTNYSCGSDMCDRERDGGIALSWHEYREPGTQFIKASTDSCDIFTKIEEVYNMPKIERISLGKKARKYIIDNYSVSAVGNKLEEIIDAMPHINWDFDFTINLMHPEYETPNIENDAEWLKDMYLHILNTEVSDDDEGLLHWMRKIEEGVSRADIENYFKKVAQDNNNKLKRVSLEDLLDKDDKGRRIAVVIPSDPFVALCCSYFIPSIKEPSPRRLPLPPWRSLQSGCAPS